MSFFPYLLASVVTSIVLGTVACAQNTPNFDNSNKNNTTNPQAVSQPISLEEDFKRINFTGSYLAARAARANYDFKAAQKNSENSFVLTSMKDTYLADQAVRLSIIQQDLDSAVELSNQHIKQLKLTDTQEVKQPIGVFTVLSLLVDRMKRNEPKQALALFEQFKNSFNTPMRALIGGSIYRLNGDAKKAELIEANLTGFDLFDMMRIYHAGNNAHLAGDDQKALELFTKSGQYIDALAVRSLLSAVQIHLKRNEEQQAIDLLKLQRRNKPDGLVWAASESLEKGEDFKFGLPNNYLQVMGEDLYNIGILYARQNDYESAIAFLRTAEIMGVSHAYLLSGLAESYAIIKDYNTASEIYLNIAKDDQFLIGRESLVGAALTLNAADRLDEAEKLLKDAIAKDKTYYRYPYVLADLLRGKQDYKRAITYFTQALNVIQEKEIKIKWRILYGRAISYEQTGQWYKAEKDFLEALELAPNNPELINYLAYSWVDRGIHLEKALSMLQHAVNTRPDSGYIVDSLGWALFRTGKYEEALPVLENAVSLMPNESVINHHLGDTYWKVGRKNEAIFQWNHALDFKPSDKDKALLKAKIKVGYDKASDYVKSQHNKSKKTRSQATTTNNVMPQNESFLNMIKSFFNQFSKQN